jgi:hypothetical protein
MSDYEISESLQLRQQRFTAALKFMTTKHRFEDQWYRKEGRGIRTATAEEAILMAEELIEMLEAPNR